MGLDLYVGSLTRYYTRDWETVVQKYAREGDLKVEVVRANDSEDAVMDPSEVRGAVLAWRDNLNKGLGNNLGQPLQWDESPTAPYFTDKPAWDCYSSLLIWAAYSEHPELIRPQSCIEAWTENEAYRRSADRESKTNYPALLRDTEIWLPSDFRFTFAAPDASGNTVNFGSVIALRDELVELNARTWQAGDSTLAEWRKNGAEHLAPLETGARFAFAIFLYLASAAAEHKLIMKLDY